MCACVCVCVWRGRGGRLLVWNEDCDLTTWGTKSVVFVPRFCHCITIQTSSSFYSLCSMTLHFRAPCHVTNNNWTSAGKEGWRHDIQLDTRTMLSQTWHNHFHGFNFELFLCWFLFLFSFLFSNCWFYSFSYFILTLLTE